MLATTEKGDAAFTVDDLDQARLWPTLDGSREPVVVHVPPASNVVLVRTRDGLLAAVLDTVGGLELVRFDGAGVVTGRTRFSPDPGFDEIDPLGERVLARRRDQVLVLLDGHGHEHASLAVNAGEHIRTVVTRGGGALVGLAESEQGAAPQAGPFASLVALEPVVDRVRVIDTTSGLAWGALHTLRAPLAGSLAVSPSGQRIAGLLASDGQPVIATPLTGELMPIAARADRFPAGTFLGFLDEETLLVSSGTLVRWRLARPISDDPWVTPNLDVQGNDNTLAVADGVVVGARGMSLQLVDPKRSRYLGYRQLANASALVFGRVGAVSSANLVTWFDANLREIATRTFPPTSARREHHVIGPHHVLQIEHSQAPRLDASVYLYGAPNQPPILLGTWQEVGTPTFHPVTRVLAIPMMTGEGAGRRAWIERFELDLAAQTTVRLNALNTDVGLTRVEVLDPVQAHGLIATGAVWLGKDMELVRFVGRSMPATVSWGQRDTVTDTDIDLGVDRSGTAYFLRSATREIVRVPASGTSSTRPVRIPDELARRTGTVSPDGKLVILLGAGMVIALDDEGTERWRMAPADAQHASFRDDGTLMLDAGSGIVVVDAATGQRRARGCAFAFELSEQAPTIETFQGENACTVDE